MIMLNFFKLINLHISDIYRWFIEVVSIDSYDVFMVGNISGIVFKRDYISSSNYLIKMSDYTINEKEKDILDALYYRKIIEEKDIIIPYKEQ